MDRIIDVIPSSQQQQIRFQLSMVLLAILSQRLLPTADGKSRVLAAEFLRNNTAIANLIREGKTHQVYSVVETASKEGMITMDRSLKQLYNEGLISIEEASALYAESKRPQGIEEALRPWQARTQTVIDFSSLEKALASLKRALDRSQGVPEDEELRDAVIQRFEYCYDLCWKMLKRQLEEEAPAAFPADRLSFRELIGREPNGALSPRPING